MSSPAIPHPVARVSQADTGTADAFKALRGAIDQSGPLDAVTRELILLASFVPVGDEAAIRIHARRLLDAGQSVQALRQAILIPLGATAGLVQVSQALGWLDDEAEQA